MLILLTIAAGAQIHASLIQMRGGSRLALRASLAPAPFWAAFVVLHVCGFAAQMPDLWWAGLIDAVGYAAIAVASSLVVQAVIATVGLIASPRLRRAQVRGEPG
jgi:hypothetical protein